MKLLKTFLVVALVVVNTGSVFAYTEITSAPEAFLSASELDVTEGCTLLTRAWKLGDKSDEILALTTFLKEKKFFKGTPRKSFSVSVEKALKAYQLDRGIFKNEEAENFGVITGTTREKISQESCKKKDIATTDSCVYISRNLNVRNQEAIFMQETKELQRFLVRKGYLSSTFVTGVYGALTREAVGRFQIDNGLISSRSDDGAGEVGPKTRAYIQLNTCGSADVRNASTSPLTGYKVTLSTRTGVVIDDANSEQVLKMAVVPQEKNSQFKSLTLQLESPSSTTTPSSYIDSLELYSANKLVGKTSSFTAVASSSDNYTAKIMGTSDYISRGQNFDLTLKVKAKSSALTSSQKEFKIFVPKDSLVMQFSNSNSVVKGDEVWGSPAQKSTFKIGTTSTDTSDSDDSDSDDDSDSNDTDDDSDDTTDTPVKEVPQINAVRPIKGTFGEMVVIRGKNFDTTQTNRIKIVQVGTGAVRTLAPHVSKNNTITFKFPGKFAPFTLANGKEVTSKYGNYRIFVVTSAGQSNFEVFKVEER